MEKLTYDFYQQDTLTVAQSLIGCYLVRNTGDGLIVGRINETEAYIGAIDKACHAYPNKRTPRTAPLFEAGGIAYVYLIYGMYNCLNIVSEPAHSPCAVLIRGAEIVEGIAPAASLRYSKPYDALTPYQLKNFSNGPGKLCKAFDIERTLNWESLLGDRLFLCHSIHGHSKAVQDIQKSKRIGIDYAEEAKDFLWRFTG